MSALIARDPEILGGTPVFVGTRVPIAVLFESLADGIALDAILDAYPTLKREQVIAVLRHANALIEHSA
jgi:uncharacterized protein (DUF433 family)